jgi:hypothetical protein
VSKLKLTNGASMSGKVALIFEADFPCVCPAPHWPGLRCCCVSD